MTFLQECMSTTIPHTFSLEHKQEVRSDTHPPAGAVLIAICLLAEPCLPATGIRWDGLQHMLP